jgi:hypothetical protein
MFICVLPVLWDKIKIKQGKELNLCLSLTNISVIYVLSCLSPWP